ncbi:MAG: hypothetical protein ABW128_15355 [Rhizorhabdus sp.]
MALILMFRGSVADMLTLMLACTLLGGSAAVAMPALGGSTVPPGPFAMVFVVARAILPGSGRASDVSSAFWANTLLGLYAAYGVLVAMIAPRIFAGQIQVVPLRYTTFRYLLDSVPLAFTPQNVIVSIYLTGTFLVAVVAYVAMQENKGPLRLVKTGVVLVWLHAFFGVSGAVFRDTAYSEVLSVVRNANYAQLDQSFGNLVRINGIFPETSSYTMFGFVWFVFMVECWYRDVLPRRTGLAAVVMVMVLMFTTSSTAYVSLFGYGLVLACRCLFLPSSVPPRKGILLAVCGLVVVVAISVVFFVAPRFAEDFSEMLQSTTLGKQASESGIQRSFWARIGWNAFLFSGGLGIGPGSFRSSSFITAVLGSSGVIGAVLFIGHFLRVWKPARASTYMPVRDERTSIGVAAGWAAFAAMIPAAVIAVSPDPGTEFALFSGVALGLRRMITRPKGALHIAAKPVASPPEPAGAHPPPGASTP